MSKRDVLIRTALLALVAVCLAAFLRESGQAIPVIGQPLPNFDLAADGGRSIRLADLRGKVVVVNFWATWCPPCVEELPSLDRFARTYAPRGVEVVAISVDDDVKAYRDFLQARSLSLRTVLDPGKSVSAQYGTFKYPETYIADRQGRLVRKIVGPADWMDPRVTEMFDELLKN
jgi:peroxiredoxin